MLNSTVCMAALRENRRTKESRWAGPALTCLLVMPPINIHPSPVPFSCLRPPPTKARRPINDNSRKKTKKEEEERKHNMREVCALPFAIALQCHAGKIRS